MYNILHSIAAFIALGTLALLVLGVLGGLSDIFKKPLPETDQSKLWLSAEEKETYIKHLIELYNQKRKLAQLRSEYDELHDQAADRNLSRNLDGSVSRHSQVGKRIAELEGLIEDAKKGIEDAKKTLLSDESIPRTRWKEEYDRMNSPHEWVIIILSLIPAIVLYGFWFQYFLGTNLFTSIVQYLSKKITFAQMLGANSGGYTLWIAIASWVVPLVFIIISAVIMDKNKYVHPYCHEPEPLSPSNLNNLGEKVEHPILKNRSLADYRVWDELRGDESDE